MTISTIPPIAMTDAVLCARASHLEREVDRAHDAGRWLDAEAAIAELDACRQELAYRSERAESERLARESAERGAREPEALVRHLDAYEIEPMTRAEILAEVWERR